MATPTPATVSLNPFCVCIFPGWGNSTVRHDVNEEEKVPLLAEKNVVLDPRDVEQALAMLGAAVGAAPVKTAKAVDADKKLFFETLSVLDLFKGLLVVLMTYSHVDLCLVNPGETAFVAVGHFIGNAASAMCFLGFMFAYGYACDYAYLSDNGKKRSTREATERLLRSAMMPICGAWVTGFAWAWLCFKMPVTWDMASSLLSLYNVVGNGPDFLVSFTTTLLVMYAVRSPVNRYLAHKSLAVRLATAATLLVVPLLITFYHVHDCTGNRKYIQFFLPCDVREAWTANLCGLPHLFYFNLGLLASRAVRGTSAAEFAAIPWGFAAAVGTGVAVVLAILAVPLASVWSMNYGNLMVDTQWGWVIRGFVDGPSCLYLLGNLFTLYLFLLACVGLHFVCKRHWAAEALMGIFRHLGANILLYLVTADIILAGMYRVVAAPQDAFPVHVYGAGWLTAGILLTTRFLHYLASSGRG